MVRLLIVDDEAELIKAFKKQLMEDGMEVVTATCAEEAMFLAKGKASTLPSST